LAVRAYTVTKFIDTAKIVVKAGDGGRGCVSFRREAYVPRGGPNGGDGGNGGSIFIEANRSFRTLIDLQYQQLYRAKRGEHGRGKDQHGAYGPDLTIKVPLGTVVSDVETGEVLVDLTTDGQRAMVAKAAWAAAATRASPPQRARRPASPSPVFQAKSAHSVSNSSSSPMWDWSACPRGEILAPGRLLGRAAQDRRLPLHHTDPQPGRGGGGPLRGLRGGGHPRTDPGRGPGAGLGIQFLRHIERTRLLVHVVDVSDDAEDPVIAAETIERELSAYSPALLSLPRIAAANKIDLPHAEGLARIQARCASLGLPLVAISALTGEASRRSWRPSRAVCERRTRNPMTSRKAPRPGSRQEWLGSPRRIVVKVGSGVLARGGSVCTGRPSRRWRARWRGCTRKGSR